MTVTTPPFIFPHIFDSCTARDNCYPPYSSSGQRQHGHHAERPRSDTESSACGSYIHSLLIRSCQFIDSIQSHNPVNTISNAAERMLESNGHFLRAQMVAEQKALETARLQEVLDTYKKENDELKMKSRLSSVFFFLLDLISTSLILNRKALALFANDYHKGGQTTSLTLHTTWLGNIPVKPAPLKCKDVLLVHHWTWKEFRCACVAQANTQRGKTEGDARSTHGNGKRKRPRKGSDKDNQPTHFYLENADGVPVSEEQITVMSCKAQMLWRTLDINGMAPQMFGQLSMQAWKYHSSMMLVDEAFDFVLLCDNGEWKLMEWSTRSYPLWYHNKFTRNVDNEIEKGESFLQ